MRELRIKRMRDFAIGMNGKSFGLQTLFEVVKDLFPNYAAFTQMFSDLTFFERMQRGYYKYIDRSQQSVIKEEAPVQIEPAG